MMGQDLVELAKQYVSLTAQLEEVRGEIRKCVLNGAGGDIIFRPPTAARRPAKAAGKTKAKAKPAHPDRATVMAVARQAEEAIVALLRQNPGLRTSQIVEGTSSQRSSTVAERLKRLKQKGLVSGGGGEGWTATAS
jgi:hypothetical protein